MRLSEAQIGSYEEQGYLLLPELFSGTEVELLQQQLAAEFAIDSPRRVLEKGGTAVRSVYGSHADNDVFARLVRHPRLVLPARQILGGDVYVYQFKVNAKAAFGGDLWEWHQDFVFWREEDGVPEPHLVNVVVFLDEVSEFNGPMFMIRGSHREGILSSQGTAGVPAGYQGSPAWISNLTADLKYSVDRATVARLAPLGMASAKGPRGTVLFFHPDLVHGSSPNLSPFDRALAIVTYNRVDNLPRPVKESRPWFLVSEDSAPLEVLDDGALAAPATPAAPANTAGGAG